MLAPFSLSGTIGSIDAGDVTPAGRSGRYLVDDRHVGGELSGDIEGTFIMTYDANVAIVTQSGPVRGTIEFYDENEDITYAARFNARSEGEFTSFEQGVGGTMELEIDGDLTFVNEANGHADWNAWLKVALDADGHIVSILDSDLNIEGSWDPDDVWA